MKRNAGQWVQICIVAAGALALAVAARADEVQSPHWKQDGCTACHDPNRGAPAAIDPANVTAVCIECHDGEKAAAESHPVGRRFDRADIRLPVDWPAPKGQLSCLTCHDVVMACKNQPTRYAANRMMIRGGPVANQTVYCGLCHVADAHARLNPHRMLTDQGQVDQASCNYCHSEALEAKSIGGRSGQPRLRGDESTLCLGCHSHHVDYFEPGHFGATADRELSQRLTVASGRLPLSPSGAVTCSTCHNPHQQGTFAGDSVLDVGGQRLDRSADQPMQLRGFGPGICGACHGR